MSIRVNHDSNGSGKNPNEKPKQLCHMTQTTEWNSTPLWSHIQKHDLHDQGLEGPSPLLRTTSWCEFHDGIRGRRQTSSSGCTLSPATVADCLRSQWTADAHTLPLLAPRTPGRPCLFSLSSASPGAPHSLASVFIRQESAENKTESAKQDVAGQLKMLLCHPPWLIPAAMLAGKPVIASNPFSFMLRTSGRSSVFRSCAHGVHVVWLEIWLMSSKRSKLHTFKHQFSSQKQRKIQKGWNTCVYEKNCC